MASAPQRQIPVEFSGRLSDFATVFQLGQYTEDSINRDGIPEGDRVNARGLSNEDWLF
jgi:hypothetical protein